jgi:hypothetical protein
MIAAVYVVYRERAIADSVRAASAWVNRFVFYSARFPGNDLPPDDTKARALAATDLPAVWVDGKPQGEVKARNAALKVARKHADWALVIDGDELLLAEWIEPSETNLGRVLTAIRAGQQTNPVGLTIYSTGLLRAPLAPQITADDYAKLPIVAAAGVQPRLFPLAKAEYRECIGAPGLFIDGVIQYPAAVEGAVLFNMRLNQTYENFQADYGWEHPA